jgi:hypothetical protein
MKIIQRKKKFKKLINLLRKFFYFYFFFGPVKPENHLMTGSKYLWCQDGTEKTLKNKKNK